MGTYQSDFRLPSSFSLWFRQNLKIGTNWQPSWKKSAILNFCHDQHFSSDKAPQKKYICRIIDFYHQFHYAFQQNLKIGYHLAAILEKIRHFEILCWVALFPEIVHTQQHICQISDFYDHFFYVFMKNLKIGSHLGKIRHFLSQLKDTLLYPGNYVLQGQYSGGIH